MIPRPGLSGTEEGYGVDKNDITVGAQFNDSKYNVIYKSIWLTQDFDWIDMDQ